MKKTFLTYLFLVAIILTKTANAVNDSDITGPQIDSGVGYSAGQGYSNSQKTLEHTYNILKKFSTFKIVYPETSPTTSPEPISATPTPDATVSGTPSPTQPVAGAFKYYRQCDYRSVRLRDGGAECTMCKAGCGITAAAGVLATLQNSSIDPPTVLKRYTELGFESGCGGTTMSAAKKILDSYGLKTSATYLFGSSKGYSINQVDEDIREKVKNGWYVFVLGTFCEGGCGHFFVITDIDSANNVTSYDPYYFDGKRFPPPSTSQPINYSRSNPFPVYKWAFAVRR